MSSILNHAMRFGLDDKHVPDDLRGKVQDYVDGYELYDHVLHAGRNPKRMDDAGLTDYAIDRCALAGSAARLDRAHRAARRGAAPRKLWVGVERRRPRRRSATT